MSGEELDLLVEPPAPVYVRMKAFVGTVYYDPSNDVEITREPTKVQVTGWVLEQLERGLIEECDAPTPEAA